MHQLTLEWTTAGQPRRRVLSISPSQPQRFLLGRDPAQCDLVLDHPTVSGLHVEISFDSAAGQFILHNLKPTNPPWVDGQAIATSTPLHPGAQIYLGQQAIAVTSVVVVPVQRVPLNLGQSLAATVLPPELLPPALLPQTPQFAAAGIPAVIAASQAAVGLRCPHCRRVLPYEQLEAGCHWCGTSLAAADSVLLDA